MKRCSRISQRSPWGCSDQKHVSEYKGCLVQRPESHRQQPGQAQLHLILYNQNKHEGHGGNEAIKTRGFVSELTECRSISVSPPTFQLEKPNTPLRERAFRRGWVMFIPEHSPLIPSLAFSVWTDHTELYCDWLSEPLFSPPGDKRNINSLR